MDKEYKNTTIDKIFKSIYSKEIGSEDIIHSILTNEEIVNTDNNDVVNKIENNIKDINEKLKEELSNITQNKAISSSAEFMNDPITRDISNKHNIIKDFFNNIKNIIKNELKNNEFNLKKAASSIIKIAKTQTVLKTNAIYFETQKEKILNDEINAIKKLENISSETKENLINKLKSIINNKENIQEIENNTTKRTIKNSTKLKPQG